MMHLFASDVYGSKFFDNCASLLLGRMKIVLKNKCSILQK